MSAIPVTISTMPRRRRFVSLLPSLIILSISFTQISSAQFRVINNAQDKYRAVHWGVEEGLSNAEVYYMIKDVHRFLWIGTSNGLNRFDGSRFKIFSHDPDNSSSIAGNTIYGLVEDSLHNLWIGTDKGLSRYDIRADTFTNFISADRNRNVVRVLFATRNEVYCMEPDLQVSVYEVHSLKGKKLLGFSSADSVDVGNSGTYSCFFDTTANNLWLLRTGGGLLKISLSDDRRKIYDWQCYKKINKHNHSAQSMKYDSQRNSLWINSEDGLVQFTITDERFHHIDALNKWVILKNFHTFGGIDIDKNGRIWLPTNPKGIIIYDPSNDSVALPFDNHPDVQKQISYETVCLYIDNENIAWTGFWSRKGLYQLIPYTPVVTRYAFDSTKKWYNSVGNFINADHGLIWIGTSQGLNIFDPHTGLFQVWHDKDLPGIRGNIIVPIAIDTTNRKAWLLAITADRTRPIGIVYEMDLSTQSCRPVTFVSRSDKRILSSDIQIIPDIINFPVTPFKNGCIITAVHENEEKVFTVGEEGGIAREILSFPNFTFYPFITTDEKHFIFMKGFDTVRNFSFSDITGKWMRTTTPFDSIKWDRIVYSKPDSSYWLITFHQLIHYDKYFNLIKKYTVKDGLPEFEIYGLGPDNNGNIWFNTDRSINQLNISTGKIITLSEKDGFMPQNFTMSEEYRVKDENGDLYFSAGFYGNGFDQIKPSKFTTSPSFVYVQSLEVNEKPFPISTGPNNVSKLSLRYFENKIALETGIIDYYSKGTSRIRYKLAGLDTNWRYGLQYHTIRYERIPPGEYKLIMQASNAANEFGGPEKIIKIHITAAFWKTWPAYTLYALLLLVTSWGFIKWRTGALKKEKTVLEKKVTARTEELKKEKEKAESALTELSSTQTQLIAEKEAKLLADFNQRYSESELKALRAQMNPHFIFNILNTIESYALDNNKEAASAMIQKFSRLTRMILENSMSQLIPFQNDWKSLRLYIELEQMRYPDKFEVVYSIEKQILEEDYFIPPMIIQPFVENAIVHGLRNKSSDRGVLILSASLQKDHIIVYVEDNGIGRRKAAALKANNPIHKKSVGIKVTHDRISIFNNLNPHRKASIEIQDLSEGTRVAICLPVSQGI